jgi:hypothetical protein
LDRRAAGPGALQRAPLPNLQASRAPQKRGLTPSTARHTDPRGRRAPRADLALCLDAARLLVGIVQHQLGGFQGFYSAPHYGLQLGIAVFCWHSRLCALWVWEVVPNAQA